MPINQWYYRNGFTDSTTGGTWILPSIYSPTQTITSTNIYNNCQTTVGTGGTSYYTSLNRLWQQQQIQMQRQANHWYAMQNDAVYDARLRQAASDARIRQDARLRQEVEARLAHVPPTEAIARSRDLLLAHLTPDQHESFIKNKWFVIEGGKSKHKYRIRDLGHLVANIDVILPSGRKSHSLCGHCRASEVPLYDSLLAQKLMLEASEDEFLRIANRHV